MTVCAESIPPSCGLNKARIDVRKYVIKRTIKKEGKKDKVRSPKIQRLITPQRLQRKRALFVDFMSLIPGF